MKTPKRYAADGFPVLVLEGKEITQNEFDRLRNDEKTTVVHKVNGPHHAARWAIDRSARSPSAVSSL